MGLAAPWLARGRPPLASPLMDALPKSRLCQWPDLPQCLRRLGHNGMANLEIPLLPLSKSPPPCQRHRNPTSCVLYPAPCVSHPAPCIPHSLSCISHPTADILHPLSCMQLPAPCILYPASHVSHPASQILHPASSPSSPFLEHDGHLHAALLPPEHLSAKELKAQERMKRSSPKCPTAGHW